MINYYFFRIRFVVAQIIFVSFATLFAMLISSNYVWSGHGGNLPQAVEPLLTEPGYWEADFNQSLIACYQGSMSACDSIWLSDRVLMDTLLHKYGKTCGGRVDRRALFRMLREVPLCTEIFPRH